MVGRVLCRRLTAEPEQPAGPQLLLLPIHSSSSKVSVDGNEKDSRLARWWFFETLPPSVMCWCRSVVPSTTLAPRAVLNRIGSFVVKKDRGGQKVPSPS